VRVEALEGDSSESAEKVSISNSPRPRHPWCRRRSPELPDIESARCATDLFVGRGADTESRRAGSRGAHQDLGRADDLGTPALLSAPSSVVAEA